MKKRILLVGSSFSAAPLFFAMKKYGFRIAVCGNIASDPCHQYADETFLIDYSKKSDLLDLVKKEKFDYIVPSCNDYSYMSCTWVAEHLGYPGFDSYQTATILHTKNRFREFTEKHNIPIPQSIRYRKGMPIDAGKIPFPLLVKPADSFSGRGVTKINAQKELPNAIEKALLESRSEEVVLEEFINGNLHSHSAFIQNGKIILDYFVDEYCTVYPYQVNCSNHPSFLSEEIRNNVRTCINSLITSLNLCDGLLHTQFIADTNSFCIIECMRRSPGDLYSHLIELSTGINYTDYYIRPFLDKKISVQPASLPPKMYGRHTITTNAPLTLSSFSQQLPSNKISIFPLKNSAEPLISAPFDKLAIIFAEYDSMERMRDITPRMADLIKIQSLEELF